MKENKFNLLNIILMVIILIGMIYIFTINNKGNDNSNRYIFSPDYANSDEILDTKSGTLYGAEDGKWIIVREISNNKFDYKQPQATDSVAVDTAAEY